MRQEFPAADTLTLELEAFAHAVRGRSPYPISGREMIDTAAAFEAIVTSVKTGGAPVEV